MTADELNQNFKALEDKIAALSAAPNPWVKCGNMEGLRATCQLAAFPSDQYEYGVVYNSPEPAPFRCLSWNHGYRLVNRDPYMVNSDNPAGTTIALGGAMFYTDTDATDDDIPSMCPSATWRHRYWRIVGGNIDSTGLGGNSCVNLDLYCRRR